MPALRSAKQHIHDVTAPLVAAYGLLPVRNLAARRGAANGVQLLWQDQLDRCTALDDTIAVKIVAIDDTSLHKGQNYLTVVQTRRNIPFNRGENLRSTWIAFMLPPPPI